MTHADHSAIVHLSDWKSYYRKRMTGMATGEIIKRICGLSLLVIFTLIPIAVDAADGGCGRILVDIHDVRVYANDLYAN